MSDTINVNVTLAVNGQHLASLVIARWQNISGIKEELQLACQTPARFQSLVVQGDCEELHDGDTLEAGCDFVSLVLIKKAVRAETLKEALGEEAYGSIEPMEAHYMLQNGSNPGLLNNYLFEQLVYSICRQFPGPQDGYALAALNLLARDTRISGHGLFYLLETAAVHNIPELCHCLLQNEALDVNARSDQTGSTVLHTAAATGNVAILKALLKTEGIDVNIRAQNGGQYSSHGLTPIQLAVHNAALEAACLLARDDRVDLNVKVDGYRGCSSLPDGCTLLDLANRNALTEFASLLLENPRYSGTGESMK
mmetsp:Transcript_119687/g.334074  ORF Transcript_119687/g.334074 Transcript_119687/m.334074 type:complete len:310 (-) Transcript_119687:52-981(-)